VFEKAQSHVDLESGDVHVWRGGNDAQTLLRIALSSHLGVEPEDLVLAHDDAGRPLLARPHVRGLSIAVSHTEGMTLVAVGLVPALGLDAELIRDDVDALDVAREVLSAEEADSLSRLAPEDRLHAFFTRWTAAEAVLKASGEGLYRDPATLVLPEGLETGCVIDALAGLPGPWWLQALPAGDTHTAAIACRYAQPRVRLWDSPAA
jgi:4'-phosphopantetheinyl transferase